MFDLIFHFLSLWCSYLAEDEVVDDRGDLTPRVVVAAFSEEHVLEAKGLALGGGWVCNSEFTLVLIS